MNRYGQSSWYSRQPSIQFIFTHHISGILSNADLVLPQPPLGPLILATLIHQKFPDWQVEVLDGNLVPGDELLNRLDADIFCFTCWSSNYDSAAKVARYVKEKFPDSIVLFGGPHPTYMSMQILENMPEIDAVFRGSGETSLMQYLSGESIESIHGVSYRSTDGSIVDSPIMGIEPPINDTPLLNLNLLAIPYEYHPSPTDPAMSAFPFSGVRGCTRGSKRCEYCSIYTDGYRMMDPVRYWQHLNYLYETYGINYFFETGDTLTPAFISKLAEHKDCPDISLRIYGFPGYFAEKDIPALQKAGVKNIFMGIESVLVWENDFKRKYPTKLTRRALIDNIRLLGDAGISVLAAFVLGLPGETKDTLAKNCDLIAEISNLDSVNEILVSPIIPFPGSEYFSRCLASKDILNEYTNETHSDLRHTDSIIFDVLSSIFIKNNSAISMAEIIDTISLLRKTLPTGVASMINS